MKYVKVIDGVVAQKQPNAQAGFIEAPDWVVCGMLQQDGTFVNPPPVPPTPEEIKAEMEAGIDQYIDSVAQAKGYDNRLTCVLRAGFTGPFQAEGTAFGQWMDSCYLVGFGIMAEVQAGTRPVPTLDEVIAEFPVMVWPE